MDSLEERRMLYAADMPDLVGLNDLRADYPTLRGQGEVVVVMDTGVNGVDYGSGNYAHPTFTDAGGVNKIWTNPDDPVDGVDNDGDGLIDNTHGWNYYAGTKDNQDTSGHGTGVASIIVSQPHTFDEDGGGPAPSVTYQGVAPDAKVLSIKLYQTTSGTDHWASKANLNAAFKWVYDHALQYNVASVVMDWLFTGATRSVSDGNPSLDDYTYDPDGAGSADHSIEWYIDNLRTGKNVLVLQAAGNNDNNTWANPGKEAGETAVSSLNIDGTKVWGDDSNVGVLNTGAQYGQNADFVDILAPGWNVIANYTNSGYTLAQGFTSFATPWVAGAAAILKQLNATITPDEIMSTLRANNSGSVTDSRPLAESGYHWDASDPILNLDSAVTAAVAQVPVGFLGTTNDIEYDSAGNLHLAWYNENTQFPLYAKRSASTGTWSAPEVIDAGAAVGTAGPSGRLGEFLSLALDSSGNPRVAYYDAGNADLRYAARSSTGIWTRSVLDFNNKTGYYPSLKIAPSGNPAISYYYSQGGDLKFAQYSSSTSSWNITTVTSSGDVGRYSRNAVDPNTSRWVIAYDDSTNTSGKYVRQMSTGAWDTPSLIDTLTTDVAYTDLVFDNSTPKRPAVSYYDTNQGNLKFAYADQVAVGQPAGTSWAAETVDSTNTRGLYTNLHYAGLSGGAALWDIVYYNSTGGTVVRASETYAKLALGQHTSVVLTTDGGANVAASWLASGSYTISYLKNDGTGLNWIDF
jgi:hypothetical protein